MHSNPNRGMYFLLGGLGLGAGVWTYMRIQQRNHLRDMLAESEAVQAATTASLITWTPEEKAAKEITFTNTKTADVAFAEILAELTPALTEAGKDAGLISEIAEIGTRGKEVFEQATGVDVDPYITEVSEAATGVAQQARESTRGLWAYFWGSPIRENPDLSWEEFLGRLN